MTPPLCASASAMCNLLIKQAPAATHPDKPVLAWMNSPKPPTDHAPGTCHPVCGFTSSLRCDVSQLPGNASVPTGWDCQHNLLPLTA